MYFELCTWGVLCSWADSNREWRAAREDALPTPRLEHRSWKRVISVRKVTIFRPKCEDWSSVLNEGTWFQGHHRAWVRGRSGEACWERNGIHQVSSWKEDVKMWTIEYFFPQTKSWVKFISWEVSDSFLLQIDAAGRHRHLFPENVGCNARLAQLYPFAVNF